MKTHGAAVMMKAELQLCADIKLTFRHCVHGLNLQNWILSDVLWLDFWYSSVRARSLSNKFPLFSIVLSSLLLLNLKDYFFILT